MTEDVLSLLDMLKDELDISKGMPLTGKRLVNVDTCMRIVGDMYFNMPEEVKRAKNIIEERDHILRRSEDEAHKIISDAQAEADRILEQAEAESKRIVSESEIVKRAEQKAETIIGDADYTANELRVGAAEYADEIMNALEKALNNALGEVQRNRKELEDVV